VTSHGLFLLPFWQALASRALSASGMATLCHLFAFSLGGVLEIKCCFFFPSYRPHRWIRFASRELLPLILDLPVAWFSVTIIVPPPAPGLFSPLSITSTSPRPSPPFGESLNQLTYNPRHPTLCLHGTFLGTNFPRFPAKLSDFPDS